VTLYPSQDSFVRGEISPRLHSRASLDLYRSALSRCENFVTLPHGGVRKRGGSQFVAAIKDESSSARLVPFKFSSTQAYCLEFGNLYIRVYAYGGFVVEIAAPWTEAQLSRLQFVQSADVMWVVHPGIQPHTVTRISNASWSVDPVTFLDGPFEAVNADEAVTVSIDSASGTATITASEALFSADDIGRLFRIELDSYEGIPPWEPNGKTGTATYVRYDGNVYRVIGGGSGVRFGATPPTHLKGVEPDGAKVADSAYAGEIVGVDLEYTHSGFGVARISGFASATVVTVAVITVFASQIVGVNSFRWSFDAFRDGFPSSVTLFEERLFYAAGLSIYGSRTGSFSEFAAGEKDDDGLEFRLASNEANEITWLADANGFLTIGTTGGVRALSGSGIDEALTPSSFKNRASSTAKCALVQPINTGKAFIYINGGKRTASEMALNQSNQFESADIFQVSEHIPKAGLGIVAAGYQDTPDPIAWFVMGNGELCSFTYQPDQEVRGFHRHRLGGVFGAADYGQVLDVAVTPGQTGSDDVWLIVKRTIGGLTRKYIEILQQPFEYGDAADAFCVDSALTYAGAAVGTVTGLGHLEGQAVEALADGVEYDGLVVSGGAVTLPGGVTASRITVGLPYVAEGETLELDAGGRDGSMMGRRKRVSSVYFSVMETDVARLEVSSKIKSRWETARLNTHAPVTGLFTGTIPPVMIDDSWQGNAQVRFRHSGPKPCTIRAMTPAFDSEP